MAIRAVELFEQFIDMTVNRRVEYPDLVLCRYLELALSTDGRQALE